MVATPRIFDDPLTDISLYPHQQDCIDGLRSGMKRGEKRLLLRAPTGFGKTRVASWIVNEVVKRRKKALFMVRGKDLVRQAHRSFANLGIPSAILMAGIPYQPELPAQVASVDTLYSRLDSLEWVNPHLIITDEAHETMVEKFQAVRDKFPSAFEIGLTATPARRDGRGLGEVYSDMIEVSEYQWLIDHGYLVRPRYFSVKESQSEVLKRNQYGEFTEASSSEAFQNVVLVGRVVDHWQCFAYGRPTVVFASSVAHSKALEEQFNARGVSAFHIDCDTPNDERSAAYEAVARGDLKVLCNYGVLNRGFDCPAISCVLLVREVGHITPLIQMIGRGLRAWPEKRDCIVIDLGENIYRHGCFVRRPVEWSLDSDVNVTDARKEKAKREPKEVRCRNCGAVFMAVAKCPECGHKVPPKERKAAEPESKDAELCEVKPEAVTEADIEMKRRWYSELKAICEQRGYRHGWVAHNYRAKFGVWPRGMRRLPPEQASDEVMNWVKHRDIKRAKLKRDGMGWHDNR